MPVFRHTKGSQNKKTKNSNLSITQVYFATTPQDHKNVTEKDANNDNKDPLSDVSLVDWAVLGETDVTYPVGAARLAHRGPSGKRVTPHQWAVYDLVRTIPCGKVTTYKYICDKLGSGSPRSVGSALRNNPFAPTIPCHRVIASDLTLGGFFGEWGTESKTNSHCAKKREMLTQEGVKFNSDGKLSKESLWSWT